MEHYKPAMHDDKGCAKKSHVKWIQISQVMLRQKAGIKVVVFCERLGCPVQKTDSALQPDKTTRRNTRS